ncbi:hypothetical protein LOK49_LG05G01006 [Camellia lanceoleosa]|uniref:Uncharacterized protein n=1 Tax=Camellia lanceoleosa TaxID=1840588 RepID=A0ACC0HVY7_9ERIC|nr:hypothetical protein LOK49_LG05G01006 [Camellia lanceoleosa]
MILISATKGVSFRAKDVVRDLKSPVLLGLGQMKSAHIPMYLYPFPNTTNKSRPFEYLSLTSLGVIGALVKLKKMMHNIRQYQVPLQKYMERNKRLFYKLLIDNVEELLPIVYTSTVGEVCQKYGSIFKHPQGLYISLKEKGAFKLLSSLMVSKFWNLAILVPKLNHYRGMGIPIGKLALYTALQEVRPFVCLPITIDVGTNNEQLLKDEFYEYADLLHEFMAAIKQNYGEKVLLQFEDFTNHNAFELLEKYRSTHLVFNDDIQVYGNMVVDLATDYLESSVVV